MSSKNLHDKPFDDSTLAKLEIFESYLKEWLPVFVQSKYKKIYIIDFFAGPGYDKDGKEGSPIRILKTVEMFLQQIINNNTKVIIVLNDNDPKKIIQLNDNITEFKSARRSYSEIIETKVENLDFEEAFHKYYDVISNYPCLIFADQNGIKFISSQYLSKLESTSKTDFLYFLSSSYIWRFGEVDEFKRHLNFDIDKLKENPYKFIHRSLIDLIKSQLPINTKLRLFPFSIKKDSNIYGIVFGAKNLLAVEKFLNLVWKKNPINGEANFDIEDDELKRQQNLFEETLTKIDRFNILLTEFIESKGVVTNKDIYILTLENGHPPKHATDQLSKLKHENKITYNGKPRINYDSVFNKKVTVNIKWIKNE
ncbi:MAG: hypothetical protein DAHOPDDO_03220 [Ignavibacteriaceae bacterium]|nr:hypothetical protein [Ignavibacteriaceae bacterium]